MAKIVPIEIIASMSGKVCNHSDMYFSTNKQTGKVHTGKICNPSTAEPTAKQLAVRQKFAERRQVTSVWMEANKPTDVRPKGTDLYQKALASYKSQHEIGSFFGYIASLVKDGKVTFGGKSYVDPNANANTSGSGNGNTGGSGSGSGGTTPGGGTSGGGESDDSGDIS